MNRQTSAEILALQALTWLVGQPEMLGQFLNATGLDASGLRDGAGDPAFLGAVLDFLLAEDDRIRAFCADAGVGLTEPMAARQALPGGDVPHWT